MDKAFTLIELLVVITIIVVLLALLAPALDRAIEAAETAACQANLRGMHVATRMYTLDNRRSFMSHRTNDEPQGGPDGEGERWWATFLIDHGAAVNLFRCPTLGGGRTDFNRTWEWNFDQHNVGYGYNGWFLGIYPLLPHEWPYSLNIRTAQVKAPADNILIGESHPIPDSGAWSQSIWWGNSSAHPGNDSRNEGVTRNRHARGSVVLFNDGHTGVFYYDADAPLGEQDPINPNDSNVTNDWHSVRYWDPLQRPELGPANGS